VDDYHKLQEERPHEDAVVTDVEACEVVPYLIPYKPIFYLKFLELGKSAFESKQVDFF
jgi:hypothetical protein